MEQVSAYYAIVYIPWSFKASLITSIHFVALFWLHFRFLAHFQAQESSILCVLFFPRCSSVLSLWFCGAYL